MTDHHRQSDDILDELKRFVEEESKRNKEWQDKHDRDAITFRTEILNKIRPFEEFSSGLNFLWKLLFGVSAFIFSLIKAWAWIRDHVR